MNTEYQYKAILPFGILVMASILSSATSAVATEGGGTHIGNGPETFVTGALGPIEQGCGAGPAERMTSGGSGQHDGRVAPPVLHIGVLRFKVPFEEDL